MSGDEVFVLVLSSIIATIAWATWVRDSLVFRSFSRMRRRRIGIALAPLFCTAVLFSILKLWSSHDVRDSPRYVVFYMAMGAAWVGIAQRVFALGGISARDDIFERRNAAAAAAHRGCLAGLTLCFAGANIGDGPGWWVVVFSALLSTSALLLLWVVLGRFTHVVDAITIDRDGAAGVRAGGFFVASGLVLGRAVAGNWESAAQTVRDFMLNGWPAVVLLGCAILFERMAKPAVIHEDLPVMRGWMPALLLVAGGVAWTLLRGGWQ